jgi:hypothetical protein
MNERESFKGAILTGLALIVFGCASIPKTPLDEISPNISLDEYYKVTRGDDLDGNVGLDLAAKDGKTEIVSHYAIIGNDKTEHGVVNILSYHGFNGGLFIKPHSLQIPQISPDEVYGLMADDQGLLHLAIDTKKDGKVNMTADFDVTADTTAGGTVFYLKYLGYKNIKSQDSGNSDLSN